MADLKGINLAMQTPFNQDGTVNPAVFEDLIERYIGAGVHGLVLGSGTGQHPYLTEHECNNLYELGGVCLTFRAESRPMRAVDR
jgi:4-hydroxy-tetrahydrodipicolinate synthase